MPSQLNQPVAEGTAPHGVWGMWRKPRRQPSLLAALAARGGDASAAEGRSSRVLAARYSEMGRLQNGSANLAAPGAGRELVAHGEAGGGLPAPSSLESRRAFDEAEGDDAVLGVHCFSFRVVVYKDPHGSQKQLQGATELGLPAAGVQRRHSFDSGRRLRALSAGAGQKLRRMLSPRTRGRQADAQGAGVPELAIGDEAEAAPARPSGGKVDAGEGKEVGAGLEKMGAAQVPAELLNSKAQEVDRWLEASLQHMVEEDFVSAADEVMSRCTSVYEDLPVSLPPSSAPPSAQQAPALPSPHTAAALAAEEAPLLQLPLAEGEGKGEEGRGGGDAAPGRGLEGTRNAGEGSGAPLVVSASMPVLLNGGVGAAAGDAGAQPGFGELEAGGNAGASEGAAADGEEAGQQEAATRGHSGGQSGPEDGVAEALLERGLLGAEQMGGVAGNALAEARDPAAEAKVAAADEADGTGEETGGSKEEAEEGEMEDAEFDFSSACAESLSRASSFAGRSQLPLRPFGPSSLAASPETCVASGAQAALADEAATAAGDTAVAGTEPAEPSAAVEMAGSAEAASTGLPLRSVPATGSHQSAASTTPSGGSAEGAAMLAVGRQGNAEEPGAEEEEDLDDFASAGGDTLSQCSSFSAGYSFRSTRSNALPPGARVSPLRTPSPGTAALPRSPLRAASFPARQALLQEAPSPCASPLTEPMEEKEVLLQAESEQQEQEEATEEVLPAAEQDLAGGSSADEGRPEGPEEEAGDGWQEEGRQEEGSAAAAKAAQPAEGGAAAGEVTDDGQAVLAAHVQRMLGAEPVPACAAEAREQADASAAAEEAAGGGAAELVPAESERQAASSVDGADLSRVSSASVEPPSNCLCLTSPAGGGQRDSGRGAAQQRQAPASSTLRSAAQKAQAGGRQRLMRPLLSPRTKVPAAGAMAGGGGAAGGAATEVARKARAGDSPTGAAEKEHAGSRKGGASPGGARSPQHGPPGRRSVTEATTAATLARAAAVRSSLAASGGGSRADSKKPRGGASPTTPRHKGTAVAKNQEGGAGRDTELRAGRGVGKERKESEAQPRKSESVKSGATGPEGDSVLGKDSLTEVAPSEEAGNAVSALHGHVGA